VHDDVHALLAQHGERRLSEHVVKTVQRRVAAQHQGGVGPESGENAGELDGDVTAAHYRNALRTPGELEEVIRGDAELGAGNHGRCGRPPVAMIMCSAARRRPAAVTVRASTKLARARTSSALCRARLAAYRSFSRRM